MDSELLHTILRQSESDTLDFKRDQYPFERESDEVQGELLKDILAFANAWKTSDAYIVVGADEKDGRMTEIVGVTKNLADHTIQQFVNGKTNRRIAFNVLNLTHETKPLTIIRISQHQQRPIYLKKKKFGGVEQNTVYVRRGSSTAVADPDETAEMGRAEEKAMIQSQSQPSIAMRFEHVIQEWGPQLGQWKGAGVEEVHLLRVIMFNDGKAVAQNVEATVSIPRVVLLDGNPLFQKKRGDITSGKSITVRNEALVQRPLNTIRTHQPILPEKKITVWEELLVTKSPLAESDSCKVVWDVSADNSAPRHGEIKFRDIPIVDERK